ncbi:peptidoglycan-binding protein [Kitasatospora sp. McL0602]|uniref:peptidoglycan-binding protein n=1 Tax=Kitasatospora sp. McL0602 TaxID=3439530 RepID=UPI003F899C64
MSLDATLNEARKWADENYRGGKSPNGKFYDTPFGAWYGMNHQPFCDMFVSYCANTAGELGSVGKYAYCPSHVQFFKGKGQWISRNGAAKRGDVVFYSWDGGPTADHVGFVLEDSAPGQSVKTVEGNTVAGDGPNQGSGGSVCYKVRPRSSVLGFGRPAYGNSAGTPPTGGQVVIDGKAYGPGSAGDHITTMGHALVRAGCSRYLEGPGPSWGSADTESMRAYQVKIGDHDSADGVPGPKQLAKLLTEYGAPAPDPEPTPPPADGCCCPGHGSGSRSTGRAKKAAIVGGLVAVVTGSGVGGAVLATEDALAPEAPVVQEDPAPAPAEAELPAGDYVVVPGDTLSEIAERAGVSLEALLTANPERTANPDLIYPGQVIVIPGDGVVPGPPEPVVYVAPEPAPEPAPEAPAEEVPAEAPAEEAAAPAASTSYSNNLDGWIEEARDILRANGDQVPSHDAILARVMTESSGNPQAINLWDSNAAAGTPSKGLIQTIDSTFQTYRLASLPDDPFDPVANIVAGVRYGNAVYGSFESVAFNSGGY